MLDSYVPEKRIYNAQNKFYGPGCEHCDDDVPVRNDYLRGYVCRDCDSALDEMLNEGDTAHTRFAPYLTKSKAA